jgi:site-specific DNA-methyltransferase (adenine-specific)
LIRRLIELFVPKNPGNLVLDPFAGSGTTLVAARELGYPYVGIEVEKSYIRLINKRLADLESGSLFPLSGDAG